MARLTFPGFLVLAASVAACSPPLALRDEVAFLTKGSSGLIAVDQGGVPVAAGGVVDFGNGFRGRPVDLSLQVTNEADADLTLGAPVLSGAGAAAFTVVTPPPATVAAHQKAAFQLRFQGASAGTSSASVTLPTSDPNHPSFTFGLTGTAAEWHGRQAALSSVEARGVQVAVSGDNVYVLYWDQAAGKLRLIKSSNGGSTWGSPYDVASGSSAGNHYRNALAVDGTTLDIAYVGNDLYFIQVFDNGAAGFSKNPSINLTSTGTIGYGTMPVIAVDDSTIHLVFSYGTSPVYTSSPRGSISFSTPQYIDSALATYSGTSQVATSLYITSSNQLVVAYPNPAVSNYTLIQSVVTAGGSLPVSEFVQYNVQTPSVDSPSVANATAGSFSSLVSYFNPAGGSYQLYEYYTYPVQSGPTGKGYKIVTIDNSSAKVGTWGTLAWSNNTAVTSYYDETNKRVRFARGTQPTPYDSSSTFTFSPTTLDSVGGLYPEVHQAVGGSGVVYVAYFDSTGTDLGAGAVGNLRIAKSLDNGVTW